MTDRAVRTAQLLDWLATGNAPEGFQRKPAALIAEFLVAWGVPISAHSVSNEASKGRKDSVFIGTRTRVS